MALFGSGDQTLSVVIKARDEASAVFSKIDGSLKKLGVGFDAAVGASKAVALGIAGAGAAVGAFGIMAVKAAGEAEVQMAKFSATLATMGPKGLAAKSAILAAADAAVKLGFDDEDAANSIAQLFQRTGDLNQALKLNGLAMDIARAKNVDLAEAGKMIALVMSGNARALKMYGIEIDDTLGPMAALEQLQGKVSGQAEGFSKTFQGQMSVFKIEFQNLLEVIGAKILPILTQFIAAMVPVIEKIIEWSGNMATLVKWFKEHQTLLLIVAGAILGALVPALVALAVSIFTVVIPAFIAAAISLAPFLIGGAIIGGMVAGILYLMKHWEQLKVGLINVWDGIKGAFREGVNFLIGLAEGWANSWVKAVNVIIGALNKISISIPDWVPGVGGKKFGINIPTATPVSLPRFEHGGIVPGAEGVAVPIIAHGQERIIPAREARNDRSGGSYTVNINNPQLRNRGDVEYLRQQIEDALRDVSRGHKLATI
jgi:hypothetical protein